MYLKQKGSGWETHCAVSAQKIQAFSEHQVFWMDPKWVYEGAQLQ